MDRMYSPCQNNTTYFDDFISSPQCRKCEKRLDSSSDRMKTKNKWWTNCLSCRTTHTTKRRAKRDAGLIPGRRGEQQRPISAKRSLHTEEDTRIENTERQKALRGSLGDTESLSAIEDELTPQGCPDCQHVVCGCSFLFSTPTWGGVAESIQTRFEHNTLLDPHTNSEVQNSGECSVCGESISNIRLIDLAACEHDPDVCNECFIGWVASQLDNTSWEKVQCPSNGCEQPITHADIKKHASSDLFTRFDKLSMIACLSADPNFRYCLAEGCRSGQIHDNSTEGNIFRCIACGFRVCTVHDVPFHTGKTCAQFDQGRREEEEQRREEDKERQEQNRMSLAEIEENATKCPGCEVPIHKFKACDHITCSRCQYEFCYICRAPYQGQHGIWTSGNKAHKTDCRYHSSRLSNYALPLDDPEATFPF